MVALDSIARSLRAGSADRCASVASAGALQGRRGRALRLSQDCANAHSSRAATACPFIGHHTQVNTCAHTINVGHTR